MGIKERRIIEKAEIRNKIKTAAIDIVSLEGYEKLSIRKIAARIDYSPTLIYLYYKDKTEIIADMSEELYDKVFHEILSIMKDSALSSDEQINKIMCAFIKGLCSEPEMVKTIMYSGVNTIFANDNSEGIPTNPGIVMCDDFIKKGIDKKVFRPDKEGISWMVISAMLGFVMCAVSNQLYLSDHFDKHIDHFVNIIIEGIKK